MNAQDIEKLGKEIRNASSDNGPSSHIQKLLLELKAGVKATDDLLRQTRIGVTVNRLRTHNDPNVARTATELVSKWRDEVKKGAKPREGAKKPADQPQGKATAEAASVSSQSQKKHSISGDKRNHKTDNVKYQVTGDDARDSCVRLMYDGLAFMSEAMPDDILRVAKQVEAAAYSNAGGINNDYKTKMRSLFQNLKNKSNQRLRSNVLSGQIAADKFVVMTHEEMKSDARRAEDAKLEKENMNEAMVAQVEKSISKEFQCGKCKKKMVSYSQAQTRSADEPMTTFCECMNCGNRWKFS